MHMKQNTLSSLFASIDAQRDALRCESAIKRFFPVAKDIMFKQRVYPDGRFGLKVLVALQPADAFQTGNLECVNVEAWMILKPENREPIDSYIGRLKKHLIALDDHAKFVEIKSEYC